MSSKLSIAFSCFIFVSLLLIAGCSSDNTSGTDTPVDDNQISFLIRFEENSAFASVAKSAEAVVTADDIDSIVSKLTIGKNTVSGGIKEVPAGKDRYIQVNVYDEKDKLCYMGKTVVDVIADEEVTASIDLYKVDETGTIIIEGVVVDDTTNTDYFTEEELNAIVKKMAVAAKVEYEKVVAVLKKGGKFYETKWKKSQLAEVEKLIAAAIKEVSGGNTDYFTVDELNTIVKKMADEAKVDYDKVVAVLKKGGKFYETKWKKEQEKEVVALIEAAIKEVSGGNTEYFTVKELCALVKALAVKAKKDVDDVFAILKKEGKLFETKWKYEQEKEVIEIIEAAVAKAKDATNTGEYFTEKELLSLAKGMAVKAKKDVDDVFAILKKEGKLFETKWKYEQKEEVIKIIAEAVAKAKDATNTGEYFTTDELNALVKKMADAATVDYEKVVAVLKEGKKFYETKWKKEQEKEVVALIEAAIKEIS